MDLRLVAVALLFVGALGASVDSDAALDVDSNSESTAAVSWGSVHGKKPSDSVFQSCTHCTSAPMCRSWCASIGGCKSVVWTAEWKTCDGYTDVFHENKLGELATAGYSGVNVTYFFKNPPSPSPSPASFLRQAHPGGKPGSGGAAYEPNFRPTIAQIVGLQSGQIGVPFQFDLAPVFQDLNQDVLTYTVGGLPQGVHLNKKFGVLMGIPKKAGRYSVALTATDMKSPPVPLPPFWLIVSNTDGSLPSSTPANTGTTVLKTKKSKKGKDKKKSGGDLSPKKVVSDNKDDKSVNLKSSGKSSGKAAGKAAGKAKGKKGKK